MGAGLENLKGLANLQTLELIDNPKLTDAGLEYLKRLTNLQMLYLTNDKKLTGVGLEHLKGLPNLQLLDLGSTAVTDAGLEHLKGFTNLKQLFLDRTRVTDAGLEHLKGLASLEKLNFLGAKVTGVGLESLKGYGGPHCLDQKSASVRYSIGYGFSSIFPRPRVRPVPRRSCSHRRPFTGAEGLRCEQERLPSDHPPLPGRPPRYASQGVR